MNNKHRGRSVGQWLWITILLLLFAATIAWLALCSAVATSN